MNLDWLIPILVIAIIAETAALVYLVRQDSPPLPSNDDLLNTINLLSSQVHVLAQETAASRKEIQDLDTRLYSAVKLIQVLSDGNMKLVIQIVDEFNGIPVWEPPSETELELLVKRPLREDQIDVRLTHLFGEAFSLDELRGVCMEFRVDYENLIGMTKQARAQSLVQLAIRENRLQELVKIGKKKRPRVNWPI